jgi:hypothetical protein
MDGAISQQKTGFISQQADFSGGYNPRVKYVSVWSKTIILQGRPDV